MLASFTSTDPESEITPSGNPSSIQNGRKPLYLTLPGLAPIEARVAWVAEFEFGCEFLKPLNPVILESIIARS